MLADDQIIRAHKRFDWGDLFWLVYLVFFLIEPLARHSAPIWLRSLGAIGIFLALYAAFLRHCGLKRRLLILGGMAALGYASYPWNAGGTCFLIYSAALLPFVTSSLPWVLGTLLVEAAVLAGEGVLLHITPYSWFSSVLLIFGVGGSNVFFAQKQRADGKLRMKQEEIEALAAVAERERIARDLHDVLGHTLSLIVLKSELAGRLLKLALVEEEGRDATPLQANLHRAHKELSEVERTARTALAEVREAIGGYRARGLAAEIESARRTLAAANVVLEAGACFIPAELSAAEETVLALALREAVTNIVRHARATRCALQLVSARDTYRLAIEDDGSHTEVREGNGLRGMRERVEAIGGQLVLRRGSGTRVEIELPLRPIEQAV